MSVEPVNENFRTRGLSVSSLPVSRECLVVMTLNTPAGTPACSASAASASADRGVSEAGLAMNGHHLTFAQGMGPAGMWVGMTSP